MKKRVWTLKIFCSLLLLLLPLAVGAQGAYSLAVHFRSGQRAVTGMELRLYRAGSLDRQGRFIPAGEFGTLRGALPEDWDTLADSLAELAKDLTPLETQKTCQQGSVTFSGLEEGLYLVVAEDENTNYEIQSFLAALPGRDPVTGDTLEAVEVYPKLRERKPPETTAPTTPPTTKPTPGKPSRLPQTGQNWQRVCVLLLCGLGLCCGAAVARKGVRRITAILAAACLLGALGSVVDNLHQSTQGGQQAEAALDQLLPVVYANAQMPKETVSPETTAAATEAPQTVPEMPTQFIDGWDYIGYLSIPALDLVLPIQSQWSYEGFRVAPGRFAGSTYTGNLVLAAHNYPQHFGRIGELQQGDLVSFTDMDGHITHYRVSALETLAPEDVDGMLAGDWSLTLFTCTLGGQSRVTVRCVEEAA